MPATGTLHIKIDDSKFKEQIEELHRHAEELAHSVARETADKVISFFTARKGFDAIWDEIDPEIREEIREELIAMLRGD